MVFYPEAREGNGLARNVLYGFDCRVVINALMTEIYQVMGSQQISMDQDDRDVI